VAAAAEE
jgi:hypothetical protein